ncbi:hypothetical protein FRC04_008861 [Tulasnella sp. 424]|nr:hypothetical protein FRC04_008861 [Tulasnella sp. 424]KAG8973763.1 hypothetical protein FRC05_008182 [Tulasnella sp. 425]
MLLYCDILAHDQDELFSDAYPVKEIDDIAYEVECAMITIKDGEVDIGANASAEEAEEALEDGAVTVNNVVHSFRLEKTEYDKKTYLAHLKKYMKALETKLGETNPDRVPAFKKGAAEFAKKIVANFKDYDFYTGSGMDLDAPGMVALLNFREDGVTPFFTFWKDGVKERKL